MLTGLGSAVAALALLILVHLVGALASEEIATRLGRLPHAGIRLATRAVPKGDREELRDDLSAELEWILHKTEGLPLTRLLRGAKFAGSLLVRSPTLSGHRSWGGILWRSLAGLFGSAWTLLWGMAAFYGPGSHVYAFWILDIKHFDDYRYLGLGETLGSITTHAMQCGCDLAFVIAGLLAVRMAAWPEYRWRQGRMPIRAAKGIWYCVLGYLLFSAISIETFFWMFRSNIQKLAEWDNRVAFVTGVLFAVAYIGGRVIGDQIDRAQTDLGPLTSPIGQSPAER